jgi:hypothetical protein
VVPLSAKLAFDVSWQVYSDLRADLNGIAIPDPTKPPSDGVWRPNSAARGEEFVADFALAGNAALKEIGKLPLQITFKLYYLSLTPFENLRDMKDFVHIREDVIAVWLDEIREAVGKEIIRRGMFPPRAYFRERQRPRFTGKIRGKVPSAHSAKGYNVPPYAESRRAW